MEPIIEGTTANAWLDDPAPLSSIEDYYNHCVCMAEDCYHTTLKTYRELKYGPNITPEFFLAEYIWVIYARSFNPKDLFVKFPEILEAYKDIFFGMSNKAIMADFSGWRWAKIKETTANEDGHKAIRDTVLLLAGYWDEFRGRVVTEPGSDDQIAWQGDWWANFKVDYLSTEDKIEQLPRVSAFKYQLARNLGHDVVKPDMRLSALANHFGFGSQEMMCLFLSELNEERIGVIDLVLAHGVSTWSTIELA